MKNLLYTTFFFLFTVSSFAYNNLIIIDPDDLWGGDQGTIEEAKITLKPTGMYTEVGLYLTFSARGTSFENDSERQLEIILNFSLPENAMMIDSWLWIEEEIVKAEIMDKWTARSIYEEIVDRKRDPSILFKNGPRNYQLRVYPMLGNSSRKVKLTYLVPTNWTKETIITNLPTEILATSLFDLPLEILVEKNDTWTNPKLFHNSNEVQMNALGNWYSYSFEARSFQDQLLNIQTQHPNSSDIFVGTYDNGEEKIYQMVLPTKGLIPASTNQKIAILIDYEVNNSRESKEQVLAQIKNWLLTNLNEEDQFNIFFSDIDIFQWSDDWKLASKENISAAKTAIKTNAISNYSNLASLFSKAIQFVDANEGGKILLFSNSSKWGDIAPANSLLEDLTALSDNKIPVFILDYQNQNYNWYHANRRSYRGNQYFYENITRMTGGEWLYGGFNGNTSFSTAMDKLNTSIRNITGDFEIYTTLKNGFCHSRYNINFSENNISNSLMQVGRFEGSFPFIIHFEGIINGQAFSNEIAVDSNNIYASNESLTDIWYGNKIKGLERDPYKSNSKISEIIDLSLRERILSNYTAFLALEPGQGGDICLECYEDDNVLIAVDETSAIDSTFSITASPNPFTESVKLKIQVSDKVDNDEIRFDIFDINGRLVKSLEADNHTNHIYEVTWNTSANQIPKGMYFFSVTTSQFRKVVKLVYH